MHRNTVIVVGFLAILAALVVGVNIGKNNSAPSANTAENIPVSPTAIIPSPTPVYTVFTDQTCGVTFSYPRNLNQMDDPSGGTMFIELNKPSDTILYECSKKITRPSVSATDITDIKIGTISARIYNDYTPASGKPMQKLIFTSPRNSFDVQISGLGNGFEMATSTAKLF